MPSAVARLLELVRFSHTLFALPFALLGAVMAWSAPTAVDTHRFSLRALLGIVLCMVFARSTAMALNRLVDRRYDALNPRTRGRHLVVGSLSVRSVWAFTLISAALFVASTLLFLPNPLPLWLSVPVLAFLWGYSFAKRFTSLSHFWLGAALMLAPVSAWIAIRGQTVIAMPSDLLPAVALGGAVLLWVAGFDIIYACQDYQFDRATGLASLPARVGLSPALHLAAVCHLGTIGMLILLPLVSRQLQWGWIYWSGIALVSALLVYEHRLVRPDDLSRVNLAFFHVNALVSIGLLVIGCLDLLTSW
jgi:4-hydroxybenzoate polyprenyltransferase